MELTTFCPHVLLAFEPLLCPGSCLNDLTLDPPPPPSEGNLGTDEIYAK